MLTVNFSTTDEITADLSRSDLYAKTKRPHCQTSPL